MTPTERIVTVLRDRGYEPRPSGKGWSARCPAHEDRRASLSIAEGDDGRALVNCHAGCSVDAVCAAVGLRVLDLMPTADKLPTPDKPKIEGTGGNGKPPIVATYDYCDERGTLLLQVVRKEPKDFKQRRPKPGGGWNWSVKGVRVIPYRLPELLADLTRPVVVAEGEKDVDNLARIGVLATCNAGGAGKWTPRHAEFLQGRSVAVLPDNDEAGRQHALQVARSLQGVAECVKIVALPGLGYKGDVSDWLSAGGTKEGLERLIQAAALWTPPSAGELWPEIEPFGRGRLPQFPTHALPPVLRQWVEAESHATQTPPDLAGLLVLEVCSAAFARRVTMKARDSWPFEPANLYVCVLLESGNRKSAVFTAATEPLSELEAELIEAELPSVARELSARRQDELRLKKLERRAAETGDAEAGDEARNLAAALAKQPGPVLPQLIVDAATSEKLEMMLAEQGGRIASLSPEGGVFDLMAGLYSKSGLTQFDVYLKGHSGDDLSSDRVSRGSVRAKRPALTCAYAVQPAVIEGLARHPAFRGRGLLARFLYAVPRSPLGQREIASAPVPSGVSEGYCLAVRSLARLQGEHVMRLADDARCMFENWEREVEVMLRDGGALEMMCDWGGEAGRGHASPGRRRALRGTRASRANRQNDDRGSH